MANEQWKLTAGDLAVASGHTVKIANTRLLNGLVKNPNQLINDLSNSLAPVSLNDIEIDEFGRVVVKNNPAFKAAVDNVVATVGERAGNNCAC